MWNETRHGGRKVVAVASQNSVVLAMGWPQKQAEGLLGFAIRRHNPDGHWEWLTGLLGFRGRDHAPGTRLPSNEAPIQKMYWVDYHHLEQGQEYDYEVIPMRGQPSALQLIEKESVRVTVRTEDNLTAQPKVYFNKATIDSQVYAQKFGQRNPASDPAILSWLARGLDQAIIGFIEKAHQDTTLSLDVAAYHLDHPGVVQALANVGSRARVSLAWKKEDDLTRNQQASETLQKAGVLVHHRTTVPQISHNKYMILKSRTAGPLAVLMGSTNFTVDGISLQSNVSMIVENEELARLYLKDFELVIAEDNQGLRDFNAEIHQVGLDGHIEVNFSPHHSGTRVDLDRYVDLVKTAKHNVFFATFRETDVPLLDALAKPLHPHVVVRGIVDRVYKQGEGDLMLYHEAHDADPEVVAAVPIAQEVGPYQRERPREGYEPLVHHKFILIDYNTPDSVVITGSANYSHNSSQNNDENTLVLHRDRRVAEMYFAEFFRLYEHYRARWLVSIHQTQSEPLYYLAEDGSWARTYYGDGHTARLLSTLLYEPRSR
jgi:phosphatidylserine/phosphatidylglycerophosphate/cardiolipin synthase-like enzyme